MTADIQALAAIAPVLGALALLDSLSVGALAVPVWLLAAPGRLRARRVLVYLAALAAFYALAGLALLGGASALLGSGLVEPDSPVLRGALFAIGAALLAASLLMEPVSRRAAPGTGRLSRWRSRALGVPDGDGGSGSSRRMVGLALVAGGLELLTMLPYLDAVGLVAGADAAFPLQAGALIGYCAVMTLPALALVLLRTVLGGALTPLLARLDRWTSAHGAGMTGWVAGVAGVVLMVHNIAHLDEALSILRAAALGGHP